MRIFNGFLNSTTSTYLENIGKYHFFWQPRLFLGVKLDQFLSRQIFRVPFIPSFDPGVKHSFGLDSLAHRGEKHRMIWVTFSYKSLNVDQYILFYQPQSSLFSPNLSFEQQTLLGFCRQPQFFGKTHWTRRLPCPPPSFFVDSFFLTYKTPTLRVSTKTQGTRQPRNGPDDCDKWSPWIWVAFKVV